MNTQDKVRIDEASWQLYSSCLRDEGKFKALHVMYHIESKFKRSDLLNSRKQFERIFHTFLDPTTLDTQLTRATHQKLHLMGDKLHTYGLLINLNLFVMCKESKQIIK